MIISVPPLASPLVGCIDDTVAGSTNVKDGPEMNFNEFIVTATMASPTGIAGERHSNS
jgi:hypothetical protein